MEVLSVLTGEGVRFATEVALSANGEDISAGANKGAFVIPFACRLVAVEARCHPAHEPSVGAVQCDLNEVSLSTGVATSVLSAVATISTGANAGSGTVAGTQEFSGGEFMQWDIDQGADGRELLGIAYFEPL